MFFPRLTRISCEKIIVVHFSRKKNTTQSNKWNEDEHTTPLGILFLSALMFELLTWKTSWHALFWQYPDVAHCCLHCWKWTDLILTLFHMAVIWVFHLLGEDNHHVQSHSDGVIADNLYATAEHVGVFIQHLHFPQIISNLETIFSHIPFLSWNVLKEETIKTTLREWTDNNK